MGNIIKKQTLDIINPNKQSINYFKNIINQKFSTNSLKIQNINKQAKLQHGNFSFFVAVLVSTKSHKSFRIMKRKSEYVIELSTEQLNQNIKVDLPWESSDEVEISKGLTPHQRKQFDSIVSLLTSGQHCCLDAPAGTGKTYLLGKLVEELGNRTIAVCSTTHKACAVLNTHLFGHDVSTIHSYLGLRQNIDFSTGLESFKLEREANKINPGSIVIVDESSMISKELIVFIRKAIEEYNLTFLFCGDSFQLPPINEIGSLALKIPNRHTLTEIVRHDNSIVDASIYCRQMIDSGMKVSIDVLSGFSDIEVVSHKEFIDLFVQEEKDRKSILYVSWTNKSVKFFGELVRERLGFPFDKFVIGETLIPTNTIVAKSGVVVVRNNVPITVESCRDTFIKGVKVQKIGIGGKLQFNTNIDLEQYKQKLSDLAEIAKVKRQWKEYYQFKDSICPVSLSHSTTVHRSQGSTVDNVYVNAGDILNSDISARLMYVAVTRAAKKVIMVC